MTISTQNPIADHSSCFTTETRLGEAPWQIIRALVDIRPDADRDRV